MDHYLVTLSAETSKRGQIYQTFICNDPFKLLMEKWDERNGQNFNWNIIFQMKISDKQLKKLKKLLERQAEEHSKKAEQIMEEVSQHFKTSYGKSRQHEIESNKDDQTKEENQEE